VSGTCVIGLQWGDEAKGKLVDLLTSRFDVVVRYQGGANAGHTVVVGDKTYKLHHIPSGILSPQVMNVVTPGVVINPPTILQELDSLAAQNVKVAENLMLSDRAHVVFPWHIAEDKVRNESTERESIGTTLRGIGPCYGDKVGRMHAIRLGDMFRDDFKTRVEQIVAAKNKFLAAMGSNSDLLDANAIYDQYSGYAARLKPFVRENDPLPARRGRSRQANVVRRSSRLVARHRSRPRFPTSPAAMPRAWVCRPGSGVPGKWITKVLGVCKAYTTRVGGGPFPTELKDDMGNKIRELGREYGTTTGRPRRCGWFDAVAVRYTSRLSGVVRRDLADDDGRAQPTA
jgi:adenylosuccinate synthase